MNSDEQDLQGLFEEFGRSNHLRLWTGGVQEIYAIASETAGTQKPTHPFSDQETTMCLSKLDCAEDGYGFFTMFLNAPELCERKTNVALLRCTDSFPFAEFVLTSPECRP